MSAVPHEADRLRAASPISHHPSDESLLRFAAGTLPAGPSLVVATHLEGCPACRARLAAFTATGGRLIEDSPPERMSTGGLADVMARIDAHEAAGPLPPPRVPRHGVDIALPTVLARCDTGPWRWFGPGVKMSRVSIPHAPKALVTLLRVGPGRALPEHTHSGLEFTQVIAGSFSDALGRYGPGDLAEMDAEVEHQPVVDADGECICLAAFDGQMVLSGLFGRLMQPFVRI